MNLYFLFLFSPRLFNVQTVRPCVLVCCVHSDFRWRTSKSISHLATTTTINFVHDAVVRFDTDYPLSVRDDNARPRSAIFTRFSSPERETDTIDATHLLYLLIPTYHPAQKQQQCSAINILFNIWSLRCSVATRTALSPSFRCFENYIFFFFIRLFIFNKFVSSTCANTTHTES